jgi:predicted AAA+ superfamily ATPase
LEAIEFFGLKEGFILTNDEEDLLVMGEVRIIIMPVWRWLLNYIPE